MTEGQDQSAAPSWMGAEIWKAARRRRRLGLGVFASVFAASAIALIVLPKRYVATASIIVAQQELGVETDKQISPDKLGDPADLESQVLLVRSPRILRMTLEQNAVRQTLLRECVEREEKSSLSRLLGASAAKCQARIDDRDKLWEYVLPRYSISGAGRSRLIAITYESQNPAIAQTMANALTTTFLNDRREGLIGKRDEAINYLKQQLRQLEESLREDQEKIQDFRRKNGIVLGASSASLAAERLSSVGQTLTQAEAARAEAGARMSNTLQLRNEALEQSPAVLASRAVGDLKQQILVNANQIASQSIALGPLHPEMQALERQRIALKRRLEVEMANQAASTKESYATASAATANIAKKMDGLKSDVADVAEKEIAISAVLRDDENKRRQIGEISRKIGELEIQKRVVSSGTELVNLAELPVIPFFPKSIPFLVGGLIVGLILAGVAIVMAERQAALGYADLGDNELGYDGPAERGAGQNFAQNIDARIIGAMPFVVTPAQIEAFRKPAQTGWKERFLSKFARQKSDALIAFRPPLKEVFTLAQTNLAVQEAAAALYATMRLKARIMACRTLVMTSLRPQEGKTLATLVLARHIAESGQSVLIVDCDFEAPVLADLFGLPPAPGLAEAARGENGPEDIVFPTDHPNLYVTPAGLARESAEEALTSPHINGFLSWAAQFDYVLFDTPAYYSTKTAGRMDGQIGARANGLALNPQALLLAPLADAIVCCAPAGADAADARDIGFMLEDLRDADGVVLGVIMTMDAGQGLAAPSRAKAAKTHKSGGPAYATTLAV